MAKFKEIRLENYKEVDAISLIRKEILKALRNEMYLSALSLSLIIPDICGKIKYPEEKDSKIYYTKWFDEYAKDCLGQLYSKGVYKNLKGPKISGKVCYQLRCRFFHNGTNDIKDRTSIDEFVLGLNNDSINLGHIAGTEIIDKNGNLMNNNYLYVGIGEICNSILGALNDFIKEDQTRISKLPKFKVNEHGGKVPSALQTKTLIKVDD